MIGEDLKRFGQGDFTTKHMPAANVKLILGTAFATPYGPFPASVLVRRYQSVTVRKRAEGWRMRPKATPLSEAGTA
jgi:hypothetical protein